MAALSRLIAKELSSALGITDNPKFNPMFKQTDETLSNVENPHTSTIAEFYSPLESAIENAPIGKKGTRGENIEAFVRKRAPKVTQAELDYREFSLDPARNYTRGDNSGAIDDGMEPLSIQAVKRTSKNKRMQRQDDLLDKEVGYEEIGVDVTSKDLKLITHYGGSNLAHARYSIRQSSDLPMPEQVETELGFQMLRPDSRYTFIEELQSDPIQNMVSDPTKKIKQLSTDYRVKFKKAMDDIASEPDFQDADSFLYQFENFIFDKYLPIATKPLSSRLQKKKGFMEIVEEIGLDPVSLDGFYFGKFIPEVFAKLAYKKLNVSDFRNVEDILLKLRNESNDVITQSSTLVSKKDTPITSLTDSVRVLLQSIIADSKAKGIDEIVLPPIEKLAEKRFPKGSDDYKKAITKGSGFHNTYVIAFEKAIKQLKGELGNQVKVGTKDLKYKTYISPKELQLAERFPRGDLAKRVAKAKTEDSVDILKGKSINIKDLKLDPTKVKLRLNKGGLVKGLMSR